MSSFRAGVDMLIFEIPVPLDRDLKEKYLALGWLELPAGALTPARLKWSHALGSPVYPGDTPPDLAHLMCDLSQLDHRLIEALAARLPDPANAETDVADVTAIITVRFARREVRRRYKGASKRVTWEANDATLHVLSS